MSVNLTLDANRRIDPLLHDTSLLSPETVERTLAIALPLINLHATTGAIASVGMGSYQAYSLAVDIHARYMEGNWTECGKQSLQLILVVSATAFALLMPLVQFAISNTYQTAVCVHTLAIDLWQGKWQESAKDLTQLLHQLVYITSVFIASPGWLALSLLSQAIFEVKQAYQEFADKGLEHLPEICLHLFLAGLRVRAAMPQIQTLHRNYFGKELSEQEWQEIYNIYTHRGRTEALFDLEEELIKRGISSHIQKIDFKPTYNLSRFYLHDLYFNECDFTGVDFEKSRFERVTCDSCLFVHATWIHAVVQDSYFNQCNFQFAAMVSSYLNNVSFSSCNLTKVCFNDSFLQHLSIDQCQMLETSFLATHVVKGVISRCDLTDCLLLDQEKVFKLKDCTEVKLTRPVVGFTWNFKQKGVFNPIMYEALSDNGAIGLRFEYLPDDIDINLLDQEVTEAIGNIQQNKPASMLSIPDEILKRAKSESQIAKIKEKTAYYMQFCDGLSLPGGSDIHPEFYGKEREEHTLPDWDYRRSMVEFALIANANEQKVVTMGTCRGSQMINVYFGGTMKQHVPDQWGFRKIDIVDSSRKEEMRRLVGDEFIAFSAHHQAADRMGKDLEVVMRADDVVKFFISQDGNFIGSQIHPEVYQTFDPETDYEMFDLDIKKIRESNKNIYKMFIDRVRGN